MVFRGSLLVELFSLFSTAFQQPSRSGHGFQPATETDHFYLEVTCPRLELIYLESQLKVRKVKQISIQHADPYSLCKFISYKNLSIEITG